MSTAVLAQDRELQAAVPLLADCLRHAVRRLRTRMLTRSGTDTPVRLVQVRLISPAELAAEMEVQQGSAWSPFYMERGQTTGFTVFEGPLLERLTARLFGDPLGTGTGLSYERSATDVELRVASRMAEELYGAIQAHWPSRPAPHLVGRPAAGNRLGVSDSGFGGGVAACVMECGPEHDPMGRLTVALPATMLRGLVTAADMPAHAQVAGRGNANYDRVLNCEVELVVELTRLQSSLGALHALRVGDEFVLGPLSEVRAMVNGHPSHTGVPGACDGVRCFRVERRVTALPAIA
jgi:flagellar motor switch protein FliM